MNSKPIAVLDLGTNTFHLLIAQISSSGNLKFLCKETIPVKLGEGGITNGKIADEAFERGLLALKHFKTKLDEYDVERVKAAGTAALRMAENGKDFIREVEAATAINIEIIDGEKEAGLIYQGVRKAVLLQGPENLIVDIGGGSVEFILCDQDSVYWKKSYPIGAARLMAQFHHTDPISQQEIDQIEKYLDQQLEDLKVIAGKCSHITLIGSAGAFETFAGQQLALHDPGVDLGERIVLDLDIEQFRIITDQLLLTTHAQRLNDPLIENVRVDMIIVASLLTRYLLHSLPVAEMKLSTYSLKEGMLFSLLSDPD